LIISQSSALDKFNRKKPLLKTKHLCDPYRFLYPKFFLASSRLWTLIECLLSCLKRSNTGAGLLLGAIAAASSFAFEGLQPVVQQFTICPTGSGVLQSQTWLRKIDTRSCVDIFSSHILDATPEPVGQIVDCCTTGLSPSIAICENGVYRFKTFIVRLGIYFFLIINFLPLEQIYFAVCHDSPINYHFS